MQSGCDRGRSESVTIETLLFIAGAVVLGSAVSGAAMWLFAARHNRRVMRRLLEELREEDDDGEDET